LALAEQAYRAELSLDAARALLPLVDILTRQAKTEEAISMLQTALEKDANPEQRAPWLIRLGDLQRGQQRWEEARQAYQAALQGKAADASAWIGLGWTAYEGQHDVAAAEQLFQQAMRADPARADAYFALAELMRRERRYPEADDYYVQALEKNPQASWGWVLRGNTARESGDLEKAIAIYQSGIAQFPNEAALYYELAWAYHLNNQPQQAVKAIEEALKLIETPNVSYYLRAGMLYEENEEINMAILNYQKILQIDPQNSIALKHIEILSK
jgi:tetratricopeptide (TPR) repeat protein